MPSPRISCSTRWRSPSSRPRGENPQRRLALACEPRYVAPASTRIVSPDSPGGRSTIDSTAPRMRERAPSTDGGTPANGAARPLVLGRQDERLAQCVRRSGHDVALARHPLLHRVDVRLGGVFDVAPAVRRAGRHERHAPAQMADEQVADAAGIARAVDDARLHDDERQPGRHRRHRHLVVRLPLAAVVDRQVRSVVAIRLVHERAMRVGEHGDRARVDALGNPELPHRVEHVAGALNIDGRGECRGPGHARPVPAGDVEHAVDALHGRAQRVWVRDVARAQLGAEHLEQRRFPSRAHERHHFVAPREQLLGHLGADESGGAGDEITRHCAQHSPPHGGAMPPLHDTWDGHSVPMR